MKQSKNPDFLSFLVEFVELTLRIIRRVNEKERRNGITSVRLPLGSNAISYYIPYLIVYAKRDSQYTELG